VTFSENFSDLRISVDMLICRDRRSVLKLTLALVFLSKYILKIDLKQELNIPALVLHSQCSLRENPRFLQNFKYKNNTLREFFY
jgi:hypothetical protein